MTTNSLSHGTLTSRWFIRPGSDRILLAGLLLRHRSQGSAVTGITLTTIAATSTISASFPSPVAFPPSVAFPSPAFPATPPVSAAAAIPAPTAFAPTFYHTVLRRL